MWKNIFVIRSENEVYCRTKCLPECNITATMRILRNFRFWTDKTTICNYFNGNFSVMESSEWPHGSIYSGVTYRLGNWYECLLVSQYNVTGQYCWATLDFDTSHHRVSNSSLEWPDERASAWNALEKVSETKLHTLGERMFWKNLFMTILHAVPAVQNPTLESESTASDMGHVYTSFVSVKWYPKFIE